MCSYLYIIGFSKVMSMMYKIQMYTLLFNAFVAL